MNMDHSIDVAVVGREGANELMSMFRAQGIDVVGYHAFATVNIKAATFYFQTESDLTAARIML